MTIQVTSTLPDRPHQHWRARLGWFLLVLVVSGAVFVGGGQMIVLYGTSWSPNDGIPWPGIEAVWLFVGQQTPDGGLTDISGARVYVNGHFVGSTSAGGPSLAVNLWRFRTYEIKVTRPGFRDWTRKVSPAGLGQVGPGPYRALDVDLEKHGG